MADPNTLRLTQAFEADPSVSTLTQVTYGWPKCFVADPSVPWLTQVPWDLSKYLEEDSSVSWLTQVPRGKCKCCMVTHVTYGWPKCFVGDLDRSRVGAFRSIHAYHVMYNIEIQGLNPGSGAQIASLIQDIKRLLISKRYTKCTTGRAVWYGHQRLAANLIMKLIKRKPQHLI